MSDNENEQKVHRALGLGFMAGLYVGAGATAAYFGVAMQAIGLVFLVWIVATWIVIILHKLFKWYVESE